MKRLNTITSTGDASLLTSRVITGGVVSITTFASCVGVTVGVHWVELAYSFSLATAITRKSFKIFTVKLEKYDAIKLLPPNKLDSIADIIS